MTARQSFQEWLADSCHASGVPLKVRDEDTLRAIAAMVAAGLRRQRKEAARGHGP